MKQWYEELFQDYAEKYDNEDFTKGTVGEVNFIEQEAAFDRSLRILDIGCGTGRHTLELARRGYQVTGIDLSESLLEKARASAHAQGLSVEFRHDDARSFTVEMPFDIALMICEAGFSLMETDEMNFSILQQAASALKPGGKLIFTTLNGLFPLYHSVKDFINQGSTQGETRDNTFDLMTFRDYSVYETTDDHGNPRILHCNERYYVPSEISWLVKTAGFSRCDIFGCKLGAFSRADRLTTEDYEMLVVAVK